MSVDKYNISKSFKFSDKNIKKLEVLTDKNGFSSDSKTMRFAIDILFALDKRNLLVEALHSIAEEDE